MRLRKRDLHDLAYVADVAIPTQATKAAIVKKVSRTKLAAIISATVVGLVGVGVGLAKAARELKRIDALMKVELDNSIKTEVQRAIKQIWRVKDNGQQNIQAMIGTEVNKYMLEGIRMRQKSTRAKRK